MSALRVREYAPPHTEGMTDPTVEQLAQVTLLDPAGSKVSMGTLWEKHPIILAMIRHFG